MDDLTQTFGSIKLNPPHKGWETNSKTGPDGTIVRTLTATGWGSKRPILSYKINGGKKQKSKRMKSRSNKRKNRRATKTRRYRK